ncbi:hypothetical protein PAMA_017399 [Pampus argenteus]
MEVVIAVLVMLLGVCHGVETHCDGRQNEARCYGALGGTLVLRLMDNALEKFRYRWYKNKTDIIFDLQKGNIEYIALKDRSIFTASNGTLRINNLSRTDGAEYTLNIFDSDGQGIDRTLLLLIQAPVSSVLVVPECLSQGKTRVSCSSEGGDSPQYSWTLDGRTLTDAELISGSKDTNNITLKQNVSGRLVCSVSNNINSVSREEMISTCEFLNCTLSNGTNISQWVFSALCVNPTTTPITSMGKETSITASNKPSTKTPTRSDEPWYINNLPVMIGVFSALVILVLVGLAVIHIQKKKQIKPKEENEELTYADVNIVQLQRRQRQERNPEMEVEYGQIKFSR